jgi:AcrR family transcriptional regulator
MASNRRGRETADRILEASRTAVAEHGLDVTIQQIAEVAGTSRMTIYRHFDSREQLLTQLVLRDSNRLAGRLTELFADDWRPFDQRLVDAVVYVVTMVKAEPHLDAIITRTSAPATWPLIDVDNRLVEAIKAFFLPHFIKAEAEGVRFRAPVEHVVDWVLRLVYMLMAIGPGAYGDLDGLRTEVETLLVPSVIHGS